MGMYVDVYKNMGPDCSMNGITCKNNALCLINVRGPWEPSDKIPGAFLAKGNLPNTAKVIPSNINKNKTWSMFGGNFVYSSDSRFNESI